MMKLRDQVITGSFNIGVDGQKEPTDWRIYALKLEALITKTQSGKYNKELIELIRKIEDDNVSIETYSQTVKWLQDHYYIIKREY